VTGLLVRGERVYASDAQDQVRITERSADDKFKLTGGIALAKPALPKYAHPAGMAWHSETELWVTSTRGNTVQLIDVETKTVKQTVPVGIAPYSILGAGNRYFVSNWGGNRPHRRSPRAFSSGSPIHIDRRTGIANQGTLSVLEEVAGRWKETKAIRVGLHPCAMALSRDGKLLYVANANSDSVSVVSTDTDQVVETISCRPEGRLP